VQHCCHRRQILSSHYYFLILIPPPTFGAVQCPSSMSDKGTDIMRIFSLYRNGVVRRQNGENGLYGKARKTGSSQACFIHDHQLIVPQRIDSWLL
jgi:hypothetical protein